MINVLITYDDNDTDLGDYFLDSFTHVTTEFSKNPLVSTTSHRGLSCTEATINGTVLGYGDARFIFVGLSHGDENTLCINTTEEDYISFNNATHFKNSLFYSTACSNGTALGLELIRLQCSTFIGYKGEISIPETDSHHEVFMRCEIYAIGEFINSLKTIQTTFNEMIDLFTSEYERLIQGSMWDVIAAAYLINARDEFTLLGSRDLVVTDFHIKRIKN